MNIVYLRVSSHKQNLANQFHEIQKHCAARNLPIHRIYTETRSGTIRPSERKLGQILRESKRGDRLIIAEISRLGRSILQIMSVLNSCMERGLIVCSLKENYELGDNLNSKLLAFAFGLSAEIERYLISERTKEALERLRSEGKRLGRPKGAQPITRRKLYAHKDSILAMREEHIPLVRIATHFGVNRKTLASFLRDCSKAGIQHKVEGDTDSNLAK